MLENLLLLNKIAELLVFLIKIGVLLLLQPLSFEWLRSLLGGSATFSNKSLVAEDSTSNPERDQDQPGQEILGRRVPDGGRSAV